VLSGRIIINNVTGQQKAAANRAANVNYCDNLRKELTMGNTICKNTSEQKHKQERNLHKMQETNPLP
jgi:hypothetical protein